MKASETKLQSVIEGTNQYVVPLFQRKYSWDAKQWNPLWEDLVGREKRGSFSAARHQQGECE
jgi:uncharacterized protein with ParB-like and HNH nuclease domain